MPIGKATTKATAIAAPSRLDAAPCAAFRRLVAEHDVDDEKRGVEHGEAEAERGPSTS